MKDDLRAGSIAGDEIAGNTTKEGMDDHDDPSSALACIFFLGFVRADCGADGSVNGDEADVDAACDGDDAAAATI